MTDWLMIAVGVVLTVGTALFVAGEFSLVALDPSTVETRAATGDKRATVVQRALGRLSTLLSGAQVGITLTTVLLGYTMQAALANLLIDLMSHWMAVSVATGAAVVIALIVVNAFSMVMGELIPKNATLSDPMRAAGLVAPFLMGFATLLKPLILVLNNAANAVLHAMGIEPAEELSGTRSAGELASLVRHSAEEGTLDASTATLLTRSIGLGALTAVDVMTDRAASTPSRPTTPPRTSCTWPAPPATPASPSSAATSTTSWASSTCAAPSASPTSGAPTSPSPPPPS